MTVWQQPEAPFKCIWPIPLSCALRNPAFGLQLRVISRHTYKRKFLPGKHYLKKDRKTRTSQQSPDPIRTAHAQEQQEKTVDLLQGELP